MEKRIVVINGPAQVGKDTFINLCEEILNQYLMTVYSYSSVDEIKQKAKELGWNGVKDDKGRKLLSDLKLASIDYNDGPTQYLERCIEQSGWNLIFLHIREPEEIAKMKALHPEALVVHMDRNNAERFVNHADSNTYNYPYDIYVNNDGDLEYLRELARGFVLELFPELKENREGELKLQ